MRMLWRGVVAGVLVAGAVAPPAVAQVPGRPYTSPYAAARARLAAGQGVVRTPVAQVPVLTSIGISSTVTVPDGGTALLGGYSRVSEGRREYGPPVLGKLP